MPAFVYYLFVWDFLCFCICILAGLQAASAHTQAWEENPRRNQPPAMPGPHISSNTWLIMNVPCFTWLIVSVTEMLCDSAKLWEADGPRGEYARGRKTPHLQLLWGTVRCKDNVSEALKNSWRRETFFVSFFCGKIWLTVKTCTGAIFVERRSSSTNT